jgi:hypothetical protein
MTEDAEPTLIAALKPARIDAWLALLRRADVWSGAALLTVSGVGVMAMAWLYFEFFGSVAAAH